MSEGKAIAPPAYYEDGARWEASVYRSVSRSRAGWRIVAIVALAASAAMAGAIVMMMPLKTYEPYMVAVDKTTGFLEVSRVLDAKALSREKAVATADLVRFIRARETYDPHTLKTDYEVASLLTTGDAAKLLENDYASSNPRNRLKVYARETIVTVQIKSVSFLNDKTASVRFMTTERTSNLEKVSHWVGIVKFRYTNAPMENQWRFDNPLGFQVTDYRRDQETIVEGTMQ